MKITKRHIEMMDAKGFNRIFEEEIGDGRTYKQVFNDLNAEYKEAFHQPRYANYQSFRKSRERRIKKKA